MLKGLRSHILTAVDYDAAVAWYTRLLGVKPYFAQPFYSGFDVAGYELGIMPLSASPGEICETTALWSVEDIYAAHARAIELGARVHSEVRDVGDGILVSSLVDPFENHIGLIANPNFAPPLVAAAAGDIRPENIVVETVVSASARRCFDLWSSSEGLAEWWLPTTRVELRPGGFYEIFFAPDLPWGRRGGEGCRVLSFLPGRMLSFTWNAPPTFAHTRSRHTWVVLQFDEQDRGTRVRLTHLGWPAAEWESEPEWAQTFSYFERAWTTVFDIFTAYHLSPTPA